MAARAQRLSSPWLLDGGGAALLEAQLLLLVGDEAGDGAGNCGHRGPNEAGDQALGSGAFRLRLLCPGSFASTFAPSNVFQVRDGEVAWEGPDLHKISMDLHDRGLISIQSKGSGPICINQHGFASAGLTTMEPLARTCINYWLSN